MRGKGPIRQRTPIPQAFEAAFAALLNPRATIDRVQPQSFRPGDRIDLEVCYTPANDEESAWQTMVVIKEGADILVQERQRHYTMRPGQVCADCDTGKTMPSSPVNLTVEVWAHPDYWTTTTPY